MAPPLAFECARERALARPNAITFHSVPFAARPILGANAATPISQVARSAVPHRHRHLHRLPALDRNLPRATTHSPASAHNPPHLELLRHSPSAAVCLSASEVGLSIHRMVWSVVASSWEWWCGSWSGRGRRACCCSSSCCCCCGEGWGFRVAGEMKCGMWGGGGGGDDEEAQE
ncbi:hypothetical protein M758_4G062600 [Ceratodon purpureus]|nr:hypothetical protein M758_4G062600 [Ceratodon purpureus]